MDPQVSTKNCCLKMSASMVYHFTIYINMNALRNGSTLVCQSERRDICLSQICHGGIWRHNHPLCQVKLQEESQMNVHYNNIVIIIMLNKVLTSGIMEHAQYTTRTGSALYTAVFFSSLSIFPIFRPIISIAICESNNYKTYNTLTHRQIN